MKNLTILSLQELKDEAMKLGINFPKSAATIVYVVVVSPEMAVSPAPATSFALYH